MKDCLKIVGGMCLEPPELVQGIVVPLSSPPIPHLALFFDGIMCRLCESQPYVCRNERKMKRYLKESHAWTSGEKGGRPSKVSQAASAALVTSFFKVTSSPVACQTFHRSNFFWYFVVKPVEDVKLASTVVSFGGDTANSNSLSLEEQVTLQLAQKLSATEPSLLGHNRHYTQVSPWLDVTQWTRYTQGHDLSLSSVVERAVEVIQQREDGDIGQELAAAQIVALDQATLLLCIALLDHALYKDIYDSIIVGFLAVLGIRKDGCFSEATTYTSYLSAFIKMTQLLVIQRSVPAVELDEVDYVADILDVMQDRFMVTMTNLKTFVAKQVSIAQQQLHDLLLADDPSISELGWNFLKHSENLTLHGYEDWLLTRVIKTDWLRDEFLENPQSVKWKKQAVHRYLKQVDSFLERLLLLVHITGGQPARGSELTSLQFCNSTHGIRRSVFIENGLVSFVTFYHKGYSIQGSTKIVHRYLPREVSELVVYYRHSTTRATAFRAQQKLFIGTSHVSRLSDVIGREFKIHLNTLAKIQVWRHAVIAITRRHIKQGKFKKDYDLGQTPTWADKQSCHTTPVAGAVYARGIEEAPGHVASARAEYRQISCEWHSWLGFALYLGNRASESERLKSTERKALEELPLNQGRKQRMKLSYAKGEDRPYEY
ncbi:hypothetical protein V493_01012 [Pseudogymnoascus sp. VKM F-4281 (FW-2241)]|nr:hypothetical protein V493_01012 [Pseudogymnoascus sp. VKM F-4281 (FW-2241)]